MGERASEVERKRIVNPATCRTPDRGSGHDDPRAVGSAPQIALDIVDRLPGAILRLAYRNEEPLRCLFASAMSPSLFGRALDDITGPEFDFQELVHADDLPVFIEAISAPTDENGEIDVEFRIVHGVDGATWVRCIGMNTGPKDGVLICDLRMVNVEARVAISEERSRLQTLLNLVLDNVPLMISVRDVEQDCFIHVNRMFQKIADRPRAEIIGQGTTGILGTERSDVRQALTRKVVEERKIVEFPEVEIEMPRLGRRIFKSTKYPIFDEEGAVRYVVAITDDITDRRNADEALRRNETRLHDAIESFSDAIALFDAEDRLVLCNSRYTRL